jgi:hypothetical protein
MGQRRVRDHVSHLFATRDENQLGDGLRYRTN